MKYQTGDIIVTRSKQWYWNVSPGYWNHVGMFVEIDAKQFVIEALPFYGVILIPAKMFFARDQIYKVLRHKPDDQGPESKYSIIPYFAAHRALKDLGKSYSLLGVFRRRNCVSLVRNSYQCITGKRLPWIVPDDLFRDMEKTHFQIIFDSEKENHET